MRGWGASFGCWDQRSVMGLAPESCLQLAFARRSAWGQASGEGLRGAAQHSPWRFAVQGTGRVGMGVAWRRAACSGYPTSLCTSMHHRLVLCRVRRQRPRRGIGNEDLRACPQCHPVRTQKRTQGLGPPQSTARTSRNVCAWESSRQSPARGLGPHPPRRQGRLRSPL